MKLTPMKVVDGVIIKKDKSSFVHIVIITASVLTAIHFEHKTGIESIWWYIGAIVVSTILIMIQMVITNRRIRMHLADDIREEDYELATLLVDKKLVYPSKIQSLLDEIKEMK